MISLSPRPAATWHDRAGAGLAGPSPQRSGRPLHCAMFAVDIVGFSERGEQLRGGLYKLVEDACEDAGVCWADRHTRTAATRSS